MSHNKPVKVYTFTVPANGAFPLLVISDYFRLQSATGAVDVSGDTFGTLPDLLTGQGLENTPYNRLVFTDKTGAPNTVSVLCSGDLFIDNRTYGVVTVSGAIALDATTLAALELIGTRPESPTGTFLSATPMAVATPVNVFTAANNPNGAIVLSASAVDSLSSSGQIQLLAKATGPVSINDGDPVFCPGYYTGGATFSYPGGNLQIPQFVPAGLGLWWVTDFITTANGHRSVRYKLL